MAGLFKRLDHVSIGVHDMEAARRLFVDLLGGEPLSDAGRSPDGFDWFTFMLGGKKLELVSPHIAGEGGVGRYIAKRGEGFHHMSIAVTNLDEAIAAFRERGLEVIGENRSNPEFIHCYLHPRQTFGAMIQVFEENAHTESMGG